MNNLNTLIYSPEWRNYPNISWSQGHYLGAPNSNVHSPADGHILRPNMNAYQNPNATNAGNNLVRPPVANSSYL